MAFPFRGGNTRSSGRNYGEDAAIIAQGRDVSGGKRGATAMRGNPIGTPRLLVAALRSA